METLPCIRRRTWRQESLSGVTQMLRLALITSWRTSNGQERTGLVQKTNTAEFSSKLAKSSGLELTQMISLRLSEKTLTVTAKKERSPKRKVKAKKAKMRWTKMRRPDRQTHLITKSLRMPFLNSLIHGVQTSTMWSTRNSSTSSTESCSTLDSKIALPMTCWHERDWNTLDEACKVHNLLTD